MLPWQEMYTESAKKVAMGWCFALLGYHSKVTLRSSQGHCKVKLAKNIFFVFFIYSKPIWGADEYYKWLRSTHYWSAISALGVITPLVFTLSHPFPKARVNQQNYWNVAVWNISFSPRDNIWIPNWVWKLPWAGVVLYLGYHPNITSRSY